MEHLAREIAADANLIAGCVAESEPLSDFAARVASFVAGLQGINGANSPLRRFELQNLPANSSFSQKCAHSICLNRSSYGWQALKTSPAEDVMNNPG